MKKTLFVLSSILIFTACSTPASEETTSPEAVVDTTAIDSSALEAPKADSVVAE